MKKSVANAGLSHSTVTLVPLLSHFGAGITQSIASTTSLSSVSYMRNLGPPGRKSVARTRFISA